MSANINKGANRIQRDPENPLDSFSVDEVNEEFAVNAISPLFTAKEAAKGFKQLDGSASRTFIMTGNKLNVVVNPPVVVFGMGKSAAAHMIKAASLAYEKQGFK
jgi:NAD(P)-dependent dehydrogenase (short-subunit alcohol dehydrogenase family)